MQKRRLARPTSAHLDHKLSLSWVLCAPPRSGSGAGEALGAALSGGYGSAVLHTAEMSSANVVARWTAVFLCSGALVGCFPLGDLAAHSLEWETTDAGRQGSIDTPPGDAGAIVQPEGVGTGSEMIPSELPLQPEPDAGPSGSSSSGDAGAGMLPPACSAEGEFPSVDSLSCYRATDAVAGWFGARAACQAWGGDLVVIDSEAEDAFITERLDVEVWIGAHDRDFEGVFVWADGSPVLYTNWDVAQPDNFQGQENCAEKRVTGFWNDRPCGGEPQEYLCERAFLATP